MNLQNMLRRKQQAAFWCERNLGRTLASVVTATRTLLRTEEEALVRQTLHEAFPGMPVATVIELANLVNTVQASK